MRRRIIGILTAAALISVAAAGIGQAHAYFTTYVEASGSNVIKLGYDTSMHEDFDSWKKTAYIKNNDDSAQGCYVRIQAFAGDDYKLVCSGSGWTEKDGWWYYDSIVEPGKETSAFDVEIFLQNGEHPSEEDMKDFNVAIVYETSETEWGTEG